VKIDHWRDKPVDDVVRSPLTIVT